MKLEKSIVLFPSQSIMVALLLCTADVLRYFRPYTTKARSFMGVLVVVF
nr:MAG TPA: hypothetical protein [Caudoviricetes sp.]